MNYDYSMLFKSRAMLANIVWGFYMGALLIVLALGFVGSGDMQLDLMVATFIVLPLVYLGTTFAYSEQRDKAIEKFVKSNGFLPLNDMRSTAELPQVLVGSGITCSVNDGFSVPLGTGSQQDFLDVFECMGTDGTKNRNPDRYTVAAFQSANELPHIFLDAKENGISHSYTDQQKISLEGNFNQYFDLFAPGMANIEARQILTPQVMQMLIDSGANYDIEINGRVVTVFSPGQLIAKNTLPALITFAQSLQKELADEQVNWDVVKDVVGSVTIGATSTELRKGSYWFRSIVSALILGIIYLIFQLLAANG
jgi:hypothetical protein